MQFQRYPRYEPITMNERKAAAFLRKQAKERARYPLFAEHVACEQHSLEDELLRRMQRALAYECNLREFHARTWRTSRAIYFTLPADLRAAIRSEWQAWSGPRSATYFAWLVDVRSGNQAKRLARIEQDQTPAVELARRRLSAASALLL